MTPTMSSAGQAFIGGHLGDTVLACLRRLTHGCRHIAGMTEMLSRVRDGGVKHRTWIRQSRTLNLIPITFSSQAIPTL